MNYKQHDVHFDADPQSVALLHTMQIGQNRDAVKKLPPGPSCMIAH